jgi:hypothetical protein
MVLRYRFGGVGIDGKTTLKYTLKKYGFEWIHLAQDKSTVVVSCEECYESFGCVKGV